MATASRRNVQGVDCESSGRPRVGSLGATIAFVLLGEPHYARPAHKMVGRVFEIVFEVATVVGLVNDACSDHQQHGLITHC